MRFPRVRGDVPIEVVGFRLKILFSPRARGCSRLCSASHIISPGFPRVRGDVPIEVVGFRLKILFSPRARGCSRLCSASHIISPGFPRVRGDVPPEKAYSVAGKIYLH